MNIFILAFLNVSYICLTDGVPHLDDTGMYWKDLGIIYTVRNTEHVPKNKCDCVELII